jgi:hypothetical protein
MANVFHTASCCKEKQNKKETITRKANLQIQSKGKGQINQTAPRKQNKWNKEQRMERKKTAKTQLRLLQFDLSFYFSSFFIF